MISKRDLPANKYTIQDIHQRLPDLLQELTRLQAEETNLLTTIKRAKDKQQAQDCQQTLNEYEQEIEKIEQEQVNTLAQFNQSEEQIKEYMSFFKDLIEICELMNLKIERTKEFKIKFKSLETKAYFQEGLTISQ